MDWKREKEREEGGRPVESVWQKTLECRLYSLGNRAEGMTREDGLNRDKIWGSIMDEVKR